MGADTKIEWCDHTFNPWWGCAKVAAGCTNCYAESQSKRYGHAVWGKDAERRFMSDAHWRQPLKWARSSRDLVGESARVRMAHGFDVPVDRPRVFCGSMCDVFEDRADLVGPRDRLFQLICDTPELDWLLLTKRPENVVTMTPWRESAALRNVWHGASIACQKDLDRNLPLLSHSLASITFLSCEPLIEHVDLCLEQYPAGLRPDWVIVGGESGPKARPCDVEWIRSIVRQCREAGVPVFVKQDSGRLPGKQGRVPDDLWVKEFPRG